MTKNHGIIVLLLGVAMLVLSLLFSSGSHPNAGFFGNQNRMEIVINEGLYHPEQAIYTSSDRSSSKSRSSSQFDPSQPTFRTAPRRPAYYEGRLTVPIKYALSLSFLVFLTGIGIAFTRKN